MTDRLAEIKARATAATPGPWKWFGNTDVKSIYLATAKWGRLFVMGFRRWGMNGAQPEFVTGRKMNPSDPGMTLSGQMCPASRLARYEVAPEAPDRTHPSVYRADINGIKTPDAEFIAHSRADVDWLIGEVDRLRELVGESPAAALAAL